MIKQLFGVWRILIPCIICAITFIGCAPNTAVSPTVTIATLAPVVTVAPSELPITNTVAPTRVVPSATSTVVVTATTTAPTLTLAPTALPTATIMPTAEISPTFAASSTVNTDNVVIEGLLFSPNPLNVPVGATVKWTNRDVAQHTVTSGFPGEPDGVFDAGTLTQNAEFSFTFEKEGAFKYFCQIHPFMTGSIVVTAP